MCTCQEQEVLGGREAQDKCTSHTRLGILKGSLAVSFIVSTLSLKSLTRKLYQHHPAEA